MNTPRKLNFRNLNKKRKQEYFDYPLCETTSYTNIRALYEEFPDEDTFDIRVICNIIATDLSRIRAKNRIR